jgi:D-threo-aldose 1-dehydrogenase
VSPGHINTLGRTTVPVSRLSIGGTPFGDMYDVVPDETALATVRAAFDAGVRYFDTAPLYGVGRAERRLGLAVRTLPRDQITISTKVGRILQDEDGTIPPTFEYDPAAVESSLAGSRERLGTDHVEIVHVHDPDQHMDEVIDVTLPLLQSMKAAGRIGAVSAGMNHSAPLARSGISRRKTPSSPPSLGPAPTALSAT